MLRTLRSLAGAGLVLTAAACGASAASAPPPPVPIALARADAPAAVPRYAGPGSAVAAHTYRIAFEVGGRVRAVAVDVGDRVAAGSVLAALDDADAAAQVDAARARAAAANATAQKARNGARAPERDAALQGVAAAQAVLERAQAAAALADANLTRFGALYREGDVSAQTYDGVVAAQRDAAGSVAAARAQRAAAQAQRALVESGTRSEDIRAAGADAAGAGAAAELAAIAFRKTVIHAPADAYVQQRAIEPGDTVGPGSAAFVLTDAAEPDVIVAVPEARLAGIVPGTPAQVRAGSRLRSGTVTRIEPAADPVTRTANVRIAVRGLALRPGSVVDVALGERRAPAAASVPLGALIGAPDGSQSVAVYDAAHRTTLRRAVRLRGTDGDRALVDGLAAGTEIVRSGGHLVVPGTPVTVVAQ